MCERFIGGGECEGEDGIAFRAQWGCDGMKERSRKDDRQGWLPECQAAVRF